MCQLRTQHTASLTLLTICGILIWIKPKPKFRFSGEFTSHHGQMWKHSNTRNWKQWRIICWYLVYKVVSFLAALWKQTITVEKEKAEWQDMETLCLLFTERQCSHLCQGRSAQLKAGRWKIQPVALVQHPHHFPLPPVKRSRNEQTDDDWTPTQTLTEHLVWLLSSEKRTTFFCNCRVLLVTTNLQSLSVETLERTFNEKRSRWQYKGLQ